MQQFGVLTERLGMAPGGPYADAARIYQALLDATPEDADVCTSTASCITNAVIRPGGRTDRAGRRPAARRSPPFTPTWPRPTRLEPVRAGRGTAAACPAPAAGLPRSAQQSRPGPARPGPRSRKRWNSSTLPCPAAGLRRRPRTTRHPSATWARPTKPWRHTARPSISTPPGPGAANLGQLLTDRASRPRGCPTARRRSGSSPTARGPKQPRQRPARPSAGPRPPPPMPRPSACSPIWPSPTPTWD